MSLRLNKVQLAGNLTRDPQAIEINGELRGAKFGLAVDRSKWDPKYQRWENVPVWLDCECWNRGEGGTLATRLLDSFRKGRPIYVEGHLKYDEWEAEGGKRSKISVVVSDWRFIESKPRDEQGDADDEGLANRPTPTPPRQQPTPTPVKPAPTPEPQPEPQPEPGPQPEPTPAKPKRGRGSRSQPTGAALAGNGTNGHAGGEDEDIPF